MNPINPVEAANTPIGAVLDFSLQPSQVRALNELPLHIAVRARDAARRDANLLSEADPQVRLLLPIVLGLARVAAAQDLAR